MKPYLAAGIVLALLVFLLPLATIQGEALSSVDSLIAAEPPASESGDKSVEAFAVETSTPPAASQSPSVEGASNDAESSAPQSQSPTAESAAASASQAVVKSDGYDESTKIRLLNNGTVEEISVHDWLMGVVAAEMPAEFELEALKAQAVAARTELLHLMENPKHENADVCADSKCCMAYSTMDDAVKKWGSDIYLSKIQEAVESTDGLAVYYNGEVIDAVFHSCASGMTENAADVWGTDLPYLQSVTSTGDEQSPRYYGKTVVPENEFKASILTSYPDADLTSDNWFGAIERCESGNVLSIEIGGVPVLGTDLRKMFGLRSTHFTVWRKDGQVCFYTTGYGHGVGMSQYGANSMAEKGKSYEEILEWYYTGAQVEAISN